MELRPKHFKLSNGLPNLISRTSWKISTMGWKFSTMGWKMSTMSWKIAIRWNPPSPPHPPPPPLRHWTTWLIEKNSQQPSTTAYKFWVGESSIKHRVSRNLSKGLHVCIHQWEQKHMWVSHERMHVSLVRDRNCSG